MNKFGCSSLAARPHPKFGNLIFEYALNLPMERSFACDLGCPKLRRHLPFWAQKGRSTLTINGVLCRKSLSKSVRCCHLPPMLRVVSSALVPKVSLLGSKNLSGPIVALNSTPCLFIFDINARGWPASLSSSACICWEFGLNLRSIVPPAQARHRRSQHPRHCPQAGTTPL